MSSPDIVISFTTAYSIIIPCCVVGLLYGIFNLIAVLSIKIEGPGSNSRVSDKEAPLIENHNIEVMIEISQKIQDVKIKFKFFRAPKHFY